MNGQVNLSNGLEAYYPFNGTFNDASGNGNNGTAVNGTTFGTDQWGNANNAASFDGVDDYIEIPASPSITPGHNFSISFRFKTVTSNLQVLLSKSNYSGVAAPNNFQYQIGINGGLVLPNNGLFFATPHTGSCITTSFLTSNYTYGSITSNNTWYCVVLTFDSGVKNTYMNGALVSSVTLSGYPNNISIDSCAGGTLRIGTWWQNDPQYFSGFMDELRLYNRTLNSQEIDSFCKLQTKVQRIGQINKYAAILAGGPCGNSYVVDSSLGFAAGDTVLMIQMKGATIDSTNTASFGKIVAYNGAGNYEKNVIKNVSGNLISLLYDVKRQYDIPRGKVQFVRVPYYKNYTVNSNQTCMAWNGSKGGVYAITVSGTLSLTDSIDVSGKGFKGGIAYDKTYSANAICNFPDFYTPPNIDSSAQKGEGIATLSLSKSYARGAAANGGGGGNAHNAGGGGGSNGGAAGIGGSNYAGCPTTTTNITGGIGGNALAINGASNKIFLGGGGGAGHSNDQTNSDGGAGGGIVFIQAGRISSFNRSIVANGNDGAVCTSTVGTYPCTDGMGGGGGAGTIIIDCPTYSGSVRTVANGGKGADIIGPAAFPTLILGPGGGGSGGVLWVSNPVMPSAVSYTANGGKNGVNINQSNNSMGAQGGNTGLSISNLKILEPIDTFKNNPLKFDFSYEIIGCYMAQFTPTATPGITSYSWLFGTFGSSPQQHPVRVFPGEGTYDVTLTVTDSNGCTYSITKPVIINAYKGFNSESTICSGQSVQLKVLSGTTFSWTPGTGLSNTSSASVIASPSTSITYYVKVTDGSGCNFIDTFNIKVIQSTVANFSYSPNPTQPNTPIQFQSSGLNATKWFWNFGDGDYSSDPNPIHLYLRNGFFNVCLVMSNDGYCPDTVCQTVQAIVKKFVGLPSAFTPNGDNENDILFVRGAGIVTVRLVIFNRWGQQVFETNDISKGWDGRFRGKPQDIDVFAYVVSATYIDGTSEMKKGNVNLLR